jgi:hypothetical protein
MDFSQAYELSSTVTEGVWRTLPSGLKVCVASLRNPAYLAEVRRLQQSQAAAMDINNPDVVVDITSKAMAKTILLDWKGAVDLEGNPVDYTTELAQDMLKRYEIFREEVSAVAADDSNYKLGIVEK